jgi:hypothetical protein
VDIYKKPLLSKHINPNSAKGEQNSTLRSVFFFQKKKQKALFRFAEGNGPPKPRRSRPWGFGGVPPKKPKSSKLIEPIGVIVFFFFQKKKQKALSRFAEGNGPPNLGEADPGGLGACPQKASLVSYIEPIGVIVFFFFQKKKQKAWELITRNSRAD